MRAIIVANGSFAFPCLPIQKEDIVIAVDGGYRHCLRLNIRPHMVVGDMDSLSSEELDDICGAGIPICRYPSRKDQTDLELAMHHARNLGADDIILLGAMGGRWDMTLANVMILASPLTAGSTVRILDGSQEICLLQGISHQQFTGNIGDTFSLIPLSAVVAGVCTNGLEYPLENETLTLGSTRSISNVICEKNAAVSIEKGLLLCAIIHEGLSLRNPA